MAIDTAVRANGAHLKHLQQRLQHDITANRMRCTKQERVGKGSNKRICARRRCSHFAATAATNCNLGVFGAVAAALRLAHDNKAVPSIPRPLSISHTLPFGLVSRLMPHATPWQGVAADNKLIKFNLKQTVAFRQASRGSRKKCFIFNWPAACGRHCGRPGIQWVLTHSRAPPAN